MLSIRLSKVSQMTPRVGPNFPSQRGNEERILRLVLILDKTKRGPSTERVSYRTAQSRSFKSLWLKIWGISMFNEMGNIDSTLVKYCALHNGIPVVFLYFD